MQASARCFHDLRINSLGSADWLPNRAALAAQAKLGVAAEEFGKWRFASLTNLQAPKLLDEQDVVASRFPVKRVPPSMHSCQGRGRAHLQCHSGLVRRLAPHKGLLGNIEMLLCNAGMPSVC